jgi:hypothetical protein
MPWIRTARAFLLVHLFLLIAAAPAALADSPQTATLEGRVLDAGGQPLPGVTVTLETDRGQQTSVTDQEGVYRFGLLPPGTYTVAATLEGMQSQPVTVRVESGQRRSQDLGMASTSETITVVSEAPLVNKFDVGTTATVEAEVAGELSFQTRNFQSATTLLPGVVHNADSQRLGDNRPALNGSEWQENAAFIDGVDTSNTRRGGSSRMFLPTTALSEVRVDASGYGAEYGRVTGGVTGVVTKSGTNDFHGEAVYIAQNQKWRAQSDFVPLPREDEAIDSYELALGGPIVRDHLWFFAAYANNSTNEIDRVPDGTIVDTSIQFEPLIGKLSAQPGASHQLSATYIDAPAEKLLPNARVGDIFALPLFQLGGEFLTANWNWSASRNTFLELRFADQDSTEDRSQAAVRTLDPSALPHTPRNAVGLFTDLTSTLQYNFNNNPLGAGDIAFPRTQANAVLSWFVGDDNELKLGADYQDLGWDTRNIKPAEFQGRGYSETLPGGFVQPVLMRVFIPAPDLISTTSEAQALYAQDRLSIGEHWALTLGARLEDQSHENDVGTEVFSSTDVSPRLAAVYDVHADGRLLLKATAGRYYAQIPQDIINADLSVLPNGTNAFDELNWNPATLRYDVFVRRFSPGAGSVVNDLEDAYHKDEATAGVEWQFANLWAFEARAIWWELDDLYWGTNQIAPNRTIFRRVANDSAATRDYRGLQLELNRSFRDNWVLRANYTLARQEGNLFGNILASTDDDDFLEARTVINPASGLPYTEENRFGRGRQDRKHALNVAGVKRWMLGEHELSLGGLLWFRSGERWGRRPNLTLAAACPSPANCVVVPGLIGTLTTTRYIQPRDANALEDLMSLNLTGGWSFPIAGPMDGSLKLEVTNVTDEQEQIDVVLATGVPQPARGFFSQPREIRALAGVRF